MGLKSIEKPCCGNYEHMNISNILKIQMCSNIDSDYIGRYVDNKDWCSKWKERKNHGKM